MDVPIEQRTVPYKLTRPSLGGTCSCAAQNAKRHPHGARALHIHEAGLLLMLEAGQGYCTESAGILSIILDDPSAPDIPGIEVKPLRGAAPCGWRLISEAASDLAYLRTGSLCDLTRCRDSTTLAPCGWRFRSPCPSLSGSVSISDLTCERCTHVLASEQSKHLLSIPVDLILRHLFCKTASKEHSHNANEPRRLRCRTSRGLQRR